MSLLLLHSLHKYSKNLKIIAPQIRNSIMQEIGRINSLRRSENENNLQDIGKFPLCDFEINAFGSPDLMPRQYRTQ